MEKLKMQIKDKLSSIKVNYIGFKIRFAKLYACIVPECEEKNGCYSKIFEMLSKKYSSIEALVDGKFMAGKIELKDGKYGNFIELPKLLFVLPKGGIEVKCNIRINSCNQKDESDGYKHQSKIWVNITNKKEFELNGSTVHNLLKETRRFCDDLAKEVGSYYSQAISEIINKSTPNTDESYWASLESVLMSSDEANQTGVESLFIVGDKKKFLKLFQKSPTAQRAMADVAEWAYEKEVKNPLEFIKKNKNDDVNWKVGISPDARIFYVKRNTDEFFHVVGVGKNLLASNDVAFVDNILLPNVAGLVAAL